MMTAAMKLKDTMVLLWGKQNAEQESFVWDELVKKEERKSVTA